MPVMWSYECEASQWVTFEPEDSCALEDSHDRWLASANPQDGGSKLTVSIGRHARSHYDERCARRCAAYVTKLVLTAALLLAAKVIPTPYDQMVPKLLDSDSDSTPPSKKSLPVPDTSEPRYTMSGYCCPATARHRTTLRRNGATARHRTTRRRDGERPNTATERRSSSGRWTA